ncbi:outer membrane protein W precursor [Ferrovum myxofaciens]|uniref:Outer membrane protein W n=1 Tax=Ferrovum myxofaciens TaxID=416213 RepID=A0A149VZY4_9PROT|nr:OmpW family outer membrane protein [Ferrovum myxofaciens]KXW58795.1 outer membrane protein W precursor [Ferrovum myxofaciens]
MKFSTKKTLVAAVALTAVAGSFAASSAFADDDAPSPWLVRVRMLDVQTQQGNDAGTVHVPGAVPIGADSIKVANRSQPEIDVSYFFTHNISAELVASYPLSHQVQLNGNYIGGFQELPPILNLQYHFDGMGNFVPYVGAGMMYMRTMNVSLLGGALGAQQNNWGEDVQLGADYMLDKHWLLNADIKKTWVSVGLNSAGATDLQLHPDPYIMGVGVGYRF